MATPTRSRPSSMRRTTPRARPVPGGRRPSIPRRRSQPQKTGLQGLISKAVPGALGAKATSKAGSSAKKPASMALLAGAAGLAYKNREKLGGLLGRSKQGEQHPEPHMHATPQPATPPPPSTPAL